jgi:prevent-host-death family protein
MKFISVRDAKARLSACLKVSQTEGVVVTHHGRPKSVVIGVEGYNMEDVVLMLSPSFWKMIESRRRQPRTSLDAFERDLAREVSSPVTKRRRTRKAS